jgi:hypothetical protein
MRKRNKKLILKVDDDYDNDLLESPKNNFDPRKFYGLWSNKNIPDLKIFREELWRA